MHFLLSMFNILFYFKSKRKEIWGGQLKLPKRTRGTWQDIIGLSRWQTLRWVRLYCLMSSDRRKYDDRLTREEPTHDQTPITVEANLNEERDFRTLCLSLSLSLEGLRNSWNLIQFFDNMSLTQFAMVEELASLVKDNLTCKHLILSVEESLVDFLQSDTSSSGVLELEPMNSYNRLLLHRLADIFGFSHESVGEGEDRHLILERCPETSIPSILVGDILWQYDEPSSPTTSHLLLKRTESPPVLRTKPPLLQHSLEEREAAYLAARERIFSRDLGEVNESVRQKPRSDPVVARRMIAHALGQRISPSSQGSPHEDCKASGGQTDELRVQGNVVDEADLTAESFQHTVSLSNRDMNSRGEVKNNHRSNRGPALTRSEKKTSQKQGDNNGRSGHGVDEEYIKREQVGAAKRMFANALGMRSGKNSSLSKCSEIKHDSTE